MSFCCLPDTNKPHQLAQFTLLCYILAKHIDCIISGVLFIVVIYTPPAAQTVSTPVLSGIYRQKQHSLVHPGSSLTEEPSAGCPPLPEDGAVLCVDLFQHAVVPQVLLTPSTAERFHKLLLRIYEGYVHKFCIQFKGNSTHCCSTVIENKFQ